MPSPRKVTVAERRARLATRHRLTPNTATPDPVALTASLLALHATDPASVYLSAAARMPIPDHAAVERAQYETHQLVRMLAMRRTMFVVTAEAAPIVQVAASDAIATRLRRSYGQLLEQAGVTSDGAAWLDRAGDAVLETLARIGELTGAELGRATPLLQTRIAQNEGKKYAATTNVTSWVTTWLAAEGRIVRGRPLGSWTANQYRWRQAENVPNHATPEARSMARAELVRRWLYAFGPAPASDVQWWTGWTLGEARAAIAAVDTVEVDLDGIPGIALETDNDPVPDAGPWVALLPALDPTPMGWKSRDWYLGEHAPRLFDVNGNIGPTVWVDGRIVGGWAQRKDGEVVFRLLDAVDAATQREVVRAANRTREAIGDARVAPRFRVPLEREIS